jgi:3-hydroxybutyryl-CoA dehydratase
MAEVPALPDVGESLDPLRVLVSEEVVRRYAEASGDYNPIHLDPAFAATTPFGGAIAHGMLLLAYLSRLLSARFGRAWLETGSLEARFRAPALVGATIVAAGSVQHITPSPEGHIVQCSLSVTNPAGQALVTASAHILLRTAA